jgi:hypothetical protein
LSRIAFVATTGSAAVAGLVYGGKKVWNYLRNATEHEIAALLAEAQKLLAIAATPMYSALIDADDATLVQILAARQDYAEFCAITGSIIARIQTILKRLGLINAKVKETKDTVALKNRVAAQTAPLTQLLSSLTGLRERLQHADPCVRLVQEVARLAARYEKEITVSESSVQLKEQELRDYIAVLMQQRGMSTEQYIEQLEADLHALAALHKQFAESEIGKQTGYQTVSDRALEYQKLLLALTNTMRIPQAQEATTQGNAE